MRFVILDNGTLRGILDSIIHEELVYRDGTIYFVNPIDIDVVRIMGGNTAGRTAVGSSNSGKSGLNPTTTISLESLLRYIVGDQNGRFSSTRSNYHGEKIKRGNWYYLDANNPIDLDSPQLSAAQEYDLVFKTTFFCTLILLFSTLKYYEVTRRIFNLQSRSISFGLRFMVDYIGGNIYDPDIALYTYEIINVQRRFSLDGQIFVGKFEQPNAKANGIAKAIDAILVACYLSDIQGHSNYLNLKLDSQPKDLLDSDIGIESIIDTAILNQDKVLRKRLKEAKREDFVEWKPGEDNQDF